MSRRSEETALRAYPISRLPFFPGSVSSYDTNEERRMVYKEGYEHAEKDTIERTIKWLKEHWREYVWITDNSIPHFGHWEGDFRKAMEEEL